MATSRSKGGRHIGGGAGAPFDPRDRFAETLDIGSLATAAIESPGTQWIWRAEPGSLGPLPQDPYAAGVAFANQQLAEVRARGLTSVVKFYLGENEVIASGASHLRAIQFAYGHAITIFNAGYIPIELNIAVGNIERADLERDDFALAKFFQWCWVRRIPVGIHAYWDFRGPDATWPDLAGRYQTIAGWCYALRDGQGRPVVTAPALWAITESGIEKIKQTPGSGPVWEMLRRGRLTEQQAIAQYLRAYARFDADTTVLLYVSFTWFHRFDPQWVDYDLAVAPNGQRWEPYRQAHQLYLTRPGLVVDPPTGQPPPPPPPPPAVRRVRVKASVAPDRIKVRIGPGATDTVCGYLGAGAEADVLAEQDGRYQLRADGQQPGGGRVFIEGWSKAEFYEDVPRADLNEDLAPD